MRRVDTLIIGQKVDIIQQTIPTFTVDKAMDCTMIELNDLLNKIVTYSHAKEDLELMVMTQGY